MPARRLAAGAALTALVATVAACSSQTTTASPPSAEAATAVTASSSVTASTAQTPTPTDATPTASHGPLNEFGITDAEYQAIVKSYEIDASRYTTPAQITAAYVDRMNKYYSDGNNRDARSSHDSYAAGDGQHFGWGVWATGLYTKALAEGMLTPLLQARGNLADQLASNDTQVKRMWANSVKAGETEYKLTIEFDIMNADVSGSQVVVTGTEIARDNSAEVPSAASDSHKVGELKSPDSSITFALDTQKNVWRVASKS